MKIFSLGSQPRATSGVYVSSFHVKVLRVKWPTRSGQQQLSDKIISTCNSVGHTVCPADIGKKHDYFLSGNVIQ
jgi:hypothetical protein